MKIGIAGPISLHMLADYLQNTQNLPEGYRFGPAAYWVEELLQRGHTISVFTLAPNIIVPQYFSGKQLKIHVGRYRGRHRARDFFKQEQQDLLNAMRKDPVDVLHANWTYEFALAGLKSGLPTLITAHDAPLNILKIQFDPYRFIRFLMAWQVCQRAPVITAVSPYIENHFQSVFRFKGKMHVIPNGIPKFVFELARTSSSYPITDRIVFVSNLTGWAGRKNGQVLIKAFAQIVQQHPNYELWMYGADHGEGQTAQAWAKKVGFEKNIRFRGHIPYNLLLRELAENADVLVHPALEESFSMAIAEAMALRIPIIGGKNSGAVSHTIGEGGLLVDVRDPNDVANAMIALATNPVLRKRLGDAGRNRAEENYSLQKVTDQYENIYHLIASQSG